QFVATLTSCVPANWGEYVSHRSGRDGEDLPVHATRQALGDEPEDLLLAGAEQGPHRAALAAGAAGIVPQEMPCKRRTDDRAAAVHRDHGLAQLLAADALVDVAAPPRRHPAH